VFLSVKTLWRTHFAFASPFAKSVGDGLDMESTVNKAGQKTRNSLSRSLIARLELDSFYNEPARFITSQSIIMLATKIVSATCLNISR
jgi:hypothetical protein